MLDLKSLERELDEALSKETEENLISWIQNRRKVEVFLSKEEYLPEYKNITENHFSSSKEEEMIFYI